MTQDEIIRMAMDAWKDHPMNSDDIPEPEGDDLAAIERFAALVEQRVRSEIALEELAKISQELGGY